MVEKRLEIGPLPEEREVLLSGEIPVLLVEGKTLPEVWEKSIIKLWNQGARVKTEYDFPDDPPSLDSQMTMIVKEPLAEPRIHLDFIGGPGHLEEYRQEVVEGIHDSWIGREGWSYSYHDRLFAYRNKDGSVTNQIEGMIAKLSQVPYSRRAQAITWDPERDMGTADPPCLQRVWCRLLRNGEGELVLNMHTFWRSRDAYKAAFENMFALTDLQRIIAEEISKRRREEVLVGPYVDTSDSYHLYGKYFKPTKDAPRGQMERFFVGLATKPFEGEEYGPSRTWSSDSELVKAIMAEAREKLARGESIRW